MKLVPELAFGQIEVHGADGFEFSVPIELAGRPDVLRELLRIAEAGGREELERIERQQEREG